MLGATGYQTAESVVGELCLLAFNNCHYLQGGFISFSELGGAV